MATDQGIAVVQFGGAFDATSSGAAVSTFAAHLAESGAMAGLLDYSAADTTAPLALVARQVKHRARNVDALRRPVALIVREDEASVWGAHAGRMSAAGFMRAAFADPQKARAWAAEMAALYAAQARFRERG